jgi:hypothetical protein
VADDIARVVRAPTRYNPLEGSHLGTASAAERLTRGAAEQHEIRRWWLPAMVFVILWGLITHGTSAGTGDEPHYEMITHSLAFDRDADLTHDYNNPDNRALFGRYEAGTHVQPGKDGVVRPVHDIGMPLLFAPYYAVAYTVTGFVIAHVPAPWLARARLDFTILLRHLLSFAMIGLTAVIAVQLFTIFCALSVSSSRAFAWAALMILSPPILSHSFLFFTEITSALIALSVFVWMQGDHVAQRTPGAGWLQALFAGAATGYLLLVHARNAGLIAGLIMVMMRRSRRRNNRPLFIGFIIGAAILFAVRTGVNYHFWGTWLTNPHERFGTVEGWQPFLTESAVRLAGWLFDQEHGLLPYAPIYLLAPAGWLALWKQERDLCIDISIVVAAYVGVMAMPTLNVHGWRGGWTPAARFLVPIAPFLAVMTFAAVARMRRVPVIVAVIAALQICLDAVLWQRPGLLWNNGIGTSALLSFLDRGTGWLSTFIPSVTTPLDGLTIALVAIITIGWVLLTDQLRLTATTESEKHAET